MNYSKVLQFLLYLIISVLQFSCSEKEDTEDSVICTLEYVAITVTVQDQNKTPISLDFYEVIISKDGSDVTPPLSSLELENAQQTGIYPLVRDGDIAKNSEEQFVFKGYINNVEVINSGYTVSADNCHISLVSGNLQLVLKI